MSTDQYQRRCCETVQACQWKGDNYEEMIRFLAGAKGWQIDDTGLRVRYEGYFPGHRYMFRPEYILLRPGTWFVRHGNDRIVLVSPGCFKASYKPIGTPEPAYRLSLRARFRFFLNRLRAL